MKKIVHFSKSFGNLYNLKKDFYLNNDLNLKNSLRVNNKYLKQKKRDKCKICNSKIKGFDFVSHKIKYKLCQKCNHLNGMHVESPKFLEWLYNSKKGKNYSRNYLKDYNSRVKNIYIPKINFLKKVIRKKNLSILDFGSGAGHFLKACELKQTKANGYEPNKILCELGNRKLKKNKLVNVTMDFVYKQILSSNVDCITLIGVLEHLQDPHKIFEIFKRSKVKYMMVSVPLFSLTSIIEHISPKVFPRLLSGAHTHLFTKESLQFLSKKYKFKIIGEWWFGLDFADLLRKIIVTSNNNKRFNSITKKYFFDHLDDFQSILDKNKISNEVHLVLKK